VRDPKERVRDVREAIANIEKYSVRGRGAFEADELLQSWFVRQLESIGEAVRAIPDGTRALAPLVPWAQIGGMRNVLVQGYFEIDTNLVWDAIQRDVPRRKGEMETLLRQLEAR